MGGTSHYNSIDGRACISPATSRGQGGGGPKYDVLHPRTGKPVKVPKSGWRFPDKSGMDRRIDDGMVEFGPDETTVPQLKRYLHETEEQVMANVIYKEPKGCQKMGRFLTGRECFNDPKDVGVIEDILRLTTQESDIVLDFFAGSGTTGESVMKLNADDGGKRKFILVQMDEKIKNDKNDAMEFCKKSLLEPVISSITLERLNRAGDMIKKEHPNTDTGYRVFSLKPKPDVVTDGSQTLLHVTHTGRDTYDTLFNMLCITGKPLDTPIKTVIEAKLYEANGEMYVLGDTDLSRYKDHRIYVDGWGEDNTLDSTSTCRGQTWR